MVLTCLLSFLWLAARPDECESCKPSKLCDAHATQVSTELKQLKKELRSKDPAVRTVVLKKAAALNADHTNAPSKDVASFLATGLGDRDLIVKAESARLLGEGQDPNVAIPALVDGVKEVAKVLGAVKSKHPDAVPAMAFAVAVLESAARYPDDRLVDSLGDLLHKHASSVYGKAVLRTADGLAAYATAGAIENLIGYLTRLEGLSKFPRTEKYIHDSLTDVARSRKLEGAPAWDEEGVGSEWKQWLKKNRKQFPKKLGKVKLETA